MTRATFERLAARGRRRATRLGRRALEAVGGRRVVVSLGTIFLVAALAVAATGLRAGQSAGTTLVTFVLVAAPAIGLVVGGARLPRADLHADFHATIAGWCLAGLAVMATGLGLYDIQPGGGVAMPVQTVPVLLALGSFAGFAAGVHDALARSRARELAHRNRQLEATREELETTVERLRSSNERLEQFAHAASHDLQEPLRMVSSYLQLLDARYDDVLDEDAREYLGFAVDGADRMRAMIEGLLAYSRVQTGGGPLEPVELDAVLADVRTDLQVILEQRHATLEVEPLPAVRGDRRQLRQVFQNLLENAVEYGGEEPQVRVFVADGPDEGEQHEESAATDTRTVAVRDDGIGIDPEHTERIFEVFERLHGREEHPGTGIGLALCERILDRHGGSISVESVPGEGSTFYVELPAARAAPDAAEDAAEAGVADDGPRAVGPEPGSADRRRAVDDAAEATQPVAGEGATGDADGKRGTRGAGDESATPDTGERPARGASGDGTTRGAAGRGTTRGTADERTQRDSAGDDPAASGPDDESTTAPDQ